MKPVASVVSKSRAAGLLGSAFIGAEHDALSSAPTRRSCRRTGT